MLSDVDNSLKIRYFYNMKTKKAMKKTVIALLLLTLSISTVLLAYLYFFNAEDKKLSGEWTAELDMTEQAAAAAFGWLQDIEAVSVSMEDMEACMLGLSVQVDLTLEQTARSGGTFQGMVPPESYAVCEQAAYEALAGAFRRLVAERLRMAGYTGSTEEDAVEALIEETFGMSAVEYLRSSGPALLPSRDELQARYGGSGTYEIAEGILVREYDAGHPVTERSERCIRQGTDLILAGEDGPVMRYTLRER